MPDPAPRPPRNLLLLWRFGILPNARQVLTEAIKKWTDRENKIVAEIEMLEGSEDWRIRLVGHAGNTIVVPSLDHLCGERVSGKELLVRLRVLHEMELSIYSLAEPTLAITAGRPSTVLDAFEFLLDQQFRNQSTARRIGAATSVKQNGRPRKCRCGHERKDHPDNGPCHQCDCAAYDPRGGP